MWLCALINLQNEVEVQLMGLNRHKRMCPECIQFATGARYSTEKQMTLHRHPVNGTWIYFKVEELGQKSVHNYTNTLCPRGNSRRGKRLVFHLKLFKSPLLNYRILSGAAYGLE